MHVHLAYLQGLVMGEMRWDDIRVFLEVARTGTLAGAAASLGVNSSTVLRRVTALEIALGVTLFQRTPRGYTLTPTGEAVVEDAGAADEVMASLRRRATGHDRMARGQVTLTMPETLVSLVAPCLATLRVMCPGLQPVIRAEDRMLDLGREAEVALRPSARPPEDAVGRRLGTIAWAVYGTDAERVLPWVVYSEEAGPRAARAWRLAHHGDVQPVVSVTSVGAMQRVLRGVEGQGLLPCYLGDTDRSLVRRSARVESAATSLWLSRLNRRVL